MLLSFLAPQDVDELLSFGPTYKDPTKGLQKAEAYLKHVHPSWLSPLLRMLASNEIALFLSCLPSLHADELKKLLLNSSNLVHLTPPAKSFLQETLLRKLREKEVLPIECLPASPLNALVELTEAELRKVAHFLGLHDLAIEIKHIIDTARLKKIYAALPHAEQQFIKRLLQKKEPIVFKKMEINRWHGDLDSLTLALEKRGWNRLGKALYDQQIGRAHV